MLSQIIVELPWNALMAVLMYFSWYYPVGLYRNAIPTDAVTERGALMFLYLLMFMLFTGTFSTLIVAGFESAEAGGNLANLLFTLCLIFCGVLATPDSLPRFWIFMYRVSPFTYLVSGMLSTGVANTEVICATNELLQFQPPANQTCQQYMQEYIQVFGGRLVDSGEGNTNTTCQFCPISDTNTFLAGVSSNYNDRWRNFGLLWVYVLFNVCGAMFVYWLARMPKSKLGGKKAKKE